MLVDGHSLQMLKARPPEAAGQFIAWALAGTSDADKDRLLNWNTEAKSNLPTRESVINLDVERELWADEPSKFFAQEIANTGRAEPRFPPDTYKPISGAIQAVVMNGEDPGVHTARAQSSIEQFTSNYSVMVESSKGAQCATRHLLESGWKKPACITGPPTASTAQQRLEGYLAALWHHYEDSVKPMVSRGEFRQEGGTQAAAELLDRKDPPDSLFIANAQMALGVLEEIRSRKLVIGVDLGIVVFDDAPWAPFVDPPITVIAQPAYEIGKRAAQLLIDRINGSAPDHCRHEILTTELILRKSSTRVDEVGS